MAEAKRKFAALASELTSMTQAQSSDKRMFGILKRKKEDEHKMPARKLQDIKLAFSEYYLSLVLLQNYQNLNFTGKGYKNILLV